MPELSITATFLPVSLAINIITLGRIHIAAKRTGTRKVVRRNDFFFTLVRYSLAIIVFMFLIFIALLLLCYKFDEYVVHTRNKFLERIYACTLGNDLLYCIV